RLSASRATLRQSRSTGWSWSVRTASSRRRSPPCAAHIPMKNPPTMLCNWRLSEVARSYSGVLEHHGYFPNPYIHISIADAIAVAVHGFGNEGASADDVTNAVHADAAHAHRGINPAGVLARNLDAGFPHTQFHTQIRVTHFCNQLSHTQIDGGARHGGKLDAPVQLQVIQIIFVHFHV